MTDNVLGDYGEFTPITIRSYTTKAQTMTDDALIEAVRLAIAKAYEESDGDGPLFLDEALAALAAARPVIRAQALEDILSYVRTATCP